MLHVDNDPPRLEIGFRHDQHEFFNSRPFTHLHVDEERNNHHEYVDTQFWYHVSDNCEDQPLTVKVSVTSNELHEASEHDHKSSMAAIRRKMSGDQSRWFQVFVAADMCKHERNDRHTLCLGDDSDAAVRFYEVQATATDMAGNINAASAYVIVVPRGTPDGPGDDRNLLIERVMQQEDRYELAEMELSSIIPQTDQVLIDSLEHGAGLGSVGVLTSSAATEKEYKAAPAHLQGANKYQAPMASTEGPFAAESLVSTAATVKEEEKMKQEKLNHEKRNRNRAHGG